MNERIEKRLLDLKARQDKDEHMPCPRCGRDSMKEHVATNALSRHADVYVCDECGTSEALLDMMQNPLPLADWACMRAAPSDFKAPTAESYRATVEKEHVPFLITLFQDWRKHTLGDDFRAYRDAANKHCPGLTALWSSPFQAEYRAEDESRLLVRLREKDGRVEYSVSVLPK